MPLERPIQKAREAKADVVRGAVSLIPWLDTFACNDCGALCEPTEGHDPDEGYFFSETGFRPVWRCSRCDIDYRRKADEDK